jgi:hypothetical protein
MKIRIGDIVNVMTPFHEGDLFYKGEFAKCKVIEITNNGRDIISKGDGISLSIIDVDDLIFKNGEYWENYK